MGWVVLLLGVLCAAFGAQVYAQSAIESAGLEFDREQPVALVADQIDYDSTTGVVTASGNVEVFYGERTLTAEQIVYDHNTGRISATGEITLRDPSGTTVFANAAELDADLTNGLVEGARAVMGENIRLSAVEARRIDQRYNSLSKVVYSACKVCADDPTPLWRIRAERVIHDETERVIHYENATLDVLGIPIAWLPYFRHPDPTIDRASGLLVPTPLHDTNFGYGIQLPYYFVIDEQSDATITPFFTTNDGLILQGEYRRLFESGAMRLAGSAAHNDFDGEGRFRGHIDSEGRFDLAYGAEWGFDINITSDDGYLRRYDISPVDTLTSELFVERYRQDSFFDAGALYFQSLRDDEPAGQVPRVFPSLDARYDMNEPYLGGTLGFFTSANVLSRNNGRDTARLSLGADWERSVTLPIGLGLRGFAEVRGDLFGIQEDNAVEDQTSLRLSPHVGVEARYPLVWDVQDGTAHIVEPIVQAIMAPYGGNDADIPIEDSINVEFDETNVIDENHFSGLDNFEEGPRINLALRYEYLNDLGLRLDASAGRVYRFRDVTAFSEDSGLSDQDSDFVAAWSAAYDPYVSVRHRMRLGDDLSVNRNEFFGAFRVDPVLLEVGYVFFEADPASGVLLDREELTARSQLQIDQNWSVGGFLRRDLEQSEFVQIGGEIGFQNECCSIDLFLKRRFTDSDDVPASTSVGVRVSLLTLGTNNNEADR